MPITGPNLIKLRAADTVQEGLLHIVPDILEPHLFFTPDLMEREEFLAMLKEIPISEGMENSFNNKSLFGFQPHLDNYSETLYEWFTENFERAMELL